MSLQIQDRGTNNFAQNLWYQVATQECTAINDVIKIARWSGVNHVLEVKQSAVTAYMYMSLFRPSGKSCLFLFPFSEEMNSVE